MKKILLIGFLTTTVLSGIGQTPHWNTAQIYNHYLGIWADSVNILPDTITSAANNAYAQHAGHTYLKVAGVWVRTDGGGTPTIVGKYPIQFILPDTVAIDTGFMATHSYVQLYAVQNIIGTPGISSDVAANRPLAGNAGRWYLATDTRLLYRDNGTGWDLIGGGGATTQTLQNTFDIGNTITRNDSIIGNFTLNFASNKAIVLPGGTTVQRPTPVIGDLRTNSDSTNRPEIYNGTKWVGLAYTADLTAVNLDQVLIQGDTSHNHQTIWLNGSGTIYANINPNAGHAGIGSFVSEVTTDSNDSTINLQAYKQITLLANYYGAVQFLRTQTTGSTPDTMYWPNTGNFYDTLATLYDIRSGIAAASGLNATLAAGNTATGKAMSLNDGGGAQFFYYNPSGRELQLGDIGFSHSGNYIDLNDISQNINMRAVAGLGLQLGGFGVASMNFLAQAAYGTGSTMRLPNTGNVTDTLATLYDIRHGGSGLAASNFVIREVPSGSINGSNVTFTLAHTPTSGTEEVYRNGILQNVGSSNDYTISGATITFNSAPLTGNIILVNYMK